MDKELLDYLNHNTNVFNANLTVGRETMPNGMEYLTFSLPDGTVIYDKWHNPKKKISRNPPKHTGGKKPYIMLMLEALRKMQGDNVDLAISSAIMLSDNIQWNTGLLVEKKKPVNYEGLKKIFNCSNDKVSKRIKAMQETGILLKDKDGYKISTDFIKKGGAKV